MMCYEMNIKLKLTSLPPYSLVVFNLQMHHDRLQHIAQKQLSTYEAIDNIRTMNNNYLRTSVCFFTVSRVPAMDNHRTGE